MRKIFLLAGIFLIFSSGIKAQVEETITEEKATDYSFVDKLPAGDRVVAGFFHDVWQGLPANVNSKGFNRGFCFQLMYDKPLGKGPFALAAGLGMSFHNLYSDAMPVKEIVNGIYTGRTLFLPIDSIAVVPVEYSKNKLNVNYLELPVEMRLRFRVSENYLKVTFGAKAGLLVNAHTKYRGDDLSGMPGEVKFKEFLLRNTESLRYSVYGRVGYSWYSVFYSMSLSPLFTKTKGPGMQPVSIGISASW